MITKDLVETLNHRNITLKLGYITNNYINLTIVRTFKQSVCTNIRRA